jgi:hypothetical protein
VPAINNLAAPAELLFQPADEKKNASINREAKFHRPDAICESEPQWWKVPARVATPKFAIIIERFLLVLFLFVTVMAIISCFVELSHLLDSDALGHLAAKAFKGGA